MPKPETFLKKREPEKPMDTRQWWAFASNVLGRPLGIKPKQSQ